MQNNAAFLPHSIYLNRLTLIDGISFTPREIDVIACLLHVRGTSKIASLLNISPTTVVTHVQNIMEKIKCNSRENVIDFVERSHSLALLKKYYAHLMVYLAFEKALKSCLKLTGNPLSSLVVYCKNHQCKSIFERYLQSHLTLAGITSKVQLQPLFNNGEDREKPKTTFIVILGEEKKTEFPQTSRDSDLIDLNDQENYYLGVLEILKKLCPKVDFDGIFLEFKKVYETMEELSKLLPAHAVFNHPNPLEKTQIDENIVHAKRKHKTIMNRLVMQAVSYLKKHAYIPAVLFIGLLGMGILILQKSQENENTQRQDVSQRPIIRSDLIIPQESVLLSRSDLIGQINDKFKNMKLQGIQTLALVGPGGAGKTTLARHYARLQNVPLVWEINAESKKGILISFEELAYKLSQTHEDKRDLREIQEMKNPLKKEAQLLSFLKKKLKSYPDWFLIYDNLESFSSILKYFPHNSTDWGKGKVLITTRDGTLQNTTYISLDHILSLRELRKAEAIELFIKILYGPQPLLSSQKEEILALLQHLPSFPLDVSVAAYYMKNSHITPKIYLERISGPWQQFETIQETMAKDISEYGKTRYRIITLSLEHLINVDKAFADLSLFISLLDSQNIPREILDKYKNAVLVDNFIYNLKKYSLIAPETHVFSIPSLSLHRSIQKIMLNHFSEAFGLVRTTQKIQQMASVMENYADEIIEKEDEPKLQLLAHHYETFLQHCQKTDGFIKNLLKAELGSIYCMLGYYAKGKQFLETALTALDKHHHQTHLIKFLIILGKIYVGMDEKDKIGKLIEQIQAIRKSHFSPEDPNSSKVLTALGDLYDSIGDYKKAQSLLNQSLLMNKQYLKNDMEMAWTLALLGTIYRKTGNFKEAINTLKESLEIYKKYGPEDHFKRGWVLIHLGNTYADIGEYEKAKELIEQGVKIYKKYSPENHIDVAWAIAYLGNIYFFMGDSKRARDLLEQSILIYRNTFSENHGGLLRTSRYLANAYIKLGNTHEAKNILGHILRNYGRVKGENQIEVAKTLQSLGEVNLLENRMDASETFIKKALEIFLKNKHSESYACWENLAEVSMKNSSIALKRGDSQQSQKFKKQAIDNLKKALEMLKAHELEFSPHFTRIQSKLKKLE